jgi:beta-N-acetylhexosaminidase
VAGVIITLRQQIAQMLIIGFAGTHIDETSPVKNWIRQEQLGGVILFDYDLRQQKQGKNLVHRTQIKHLIEQLQEEALSAKGAIPLFVAIDYEGGIVDRLKHVPDCFSTLTPYELASLSESEFKFHVNQMAETIKHLGFNLNFAPVVDLDLTKEHGIIGKLGRSFSSDPKRVDEVASLFIDLFAKHNIACCYKHFPGHGSAIGDTHEDFVDVTETFQSIELEPFNKTAGKANWPAMIMTAHVINRELDPSGLPATLSKRMLTGLLREEFNFHGVIVSDDLQMLAIAKHYSLEEALSLTINAGADMLIFGNQLGEITAPEVIDKIENLVKTGIIPAERITEAHNRIISLKRLIKLT